MAGSAAAEMAGAAPAADSAMKMMPEAPASAATPGPQIAYSYGLSYRLPAASIAKAQSAHIAMCDALGAAHCRVTGQNRSDPDGGYASGSLTLQVNAAQARAFADRMDAAIAKADGKPAGRSLAAEDLSKQIIDVEARIAAKQALATRLLELLKRRDAKVSDLVEAERAYAQTQEELDAARSTMEEFSSRVRMSSITADYQAVAPGGAAASRPIVDALSSASRTFGHSIAILISFAVAAIPWVALALATLWVVRRLLKRRRARTAVTSPEES